MDTPMSLTHPTVRVASRRLPAPAYYVALPRRLIEDCQRTPQAIGVYALIARLYRVTRAPVPLSPADLHAYDPQLSPTRALRALQRLKARGYLTAAEQPGRKTRYTPTWGPIRGVPRVWDLDAPGLGRPGHSEYLRLDQRLLDTCLGRLRPHVDYPAQVERYLTTPLISLSDVGAYACALIGLPARSLTLAALGLLVNAEVASLPDDTTLLAIASQRAAGTEALTASGWRRTPWAKQTRATEPGAPLFFVPRDRIGQGIGQPIHDPITACTDTVCGLSALERDIPAALDPPSRVHGGMYLDEEETTTSAYEVQTMTQVGGGKNQHPKEEETVQHCPSSIATCTLPARNEAYVAPRPRTHIDTDGGRDRCASPSEHVASPALQQAIGISAHCSTPTAHTGDDEGRSMLRSLSQKTHDPTSAVTSPMAPAALPEVAHMLLAVGVRRDVAHQLAARPLTQVARVIAQARARQGVRDVAGWVVSALRALPESEPEPVVPTPKVSDLAILTHRGLSNHERVRWLTRFRSAEPADRPAVLARFHAEHPDTGLAVQSLNAEQPEIAPHPATCTGERSLTGR